MVHQFSLDIHTQSHTIPSAYKFTGTPESDICRYAHILISSYIVY